MPVNTYHGHVNKNTIHHKTEQIGKPENNWVPMLHLQIWSSRSRSELDVDSSSRSATGRPAPWIRSSSSRSWSETQVTLRYLRVHPGQTFTAGQPQHHLVRSAINLIVYEDRIRHHVTAYVTARSGMHQCLTTS